MKNCELCRLPARIFCESDQAILCWDCDAKVHGANFLVSRHSRSLLCHGCQSPTPWKASGEKLGHTFSVCESCVLPDGGRDDDDESQGGNDEEFDSDNDEIDDDDDDDDDEDFDFDEDGDNQVVPLSSTATPPPPTSSASSGEQSATAFNNGGGGDSKTANAAAAAVSLKRFRETASDLRSQIADLDRSCPHQRCGSAKAARAGPSERNGGATSVDSSRPRKNRRIDLNRPASPSSPVIEPPRSFRRQGNP